MGRTRSSNASKLIEKSNSLKCSRTNPSLEINELQPEVLNQPSNEAGSHPSIFASRKQKMNPTAIVRRSPRILQNTLANVLEVNEDSTMLNISSPKNKMGKQRTVVRQSQPILEIISKTVEENEGEPSGHENQKNPEPTQYETSNEEKFMSISRLLEAQGKAINALKSKQSEVMCQCSCLADIRYKNMYYDSRKKTEALRDENHQLALKLERARGKLEVYENGSQIHPFLGVLEKLKESMLIPYMPKFSETTLNGQALSPNTDRAEPRSNAVQKRKRECRNK